MAAVLKYNSYFTAYEYVYATICFKIYLELEKVYQPALICYTPSYLEIVQVLHELLRFKRLYSIGDIFENSKSVKEQTIRGYLSQKSKQKPERISAVLFDTYLNKPGVSNSFVGNRRHVLKYICELVKAGEVKYAGKQKNITMYQVHGKPKLISEVEVLVLVKLRSEL